MTDYHIFGSNDKAATELATCELVLILAAKYLGSTTVETVLKRHHIMHTAPPILEGEHE